MPSSRLVVLSLRYSSWSMRPWLALTAAGVDFETCTVEIPEIGAAGDETGEAALAELRRNRLADRRRLGSVTGLFPVLEVAGRRIHESLAICEWVAERHPEAELWPPDPLDRARARSLCCEMMTGFASLRTEMSCHVFARVPDFRPSASTQVDIERVLEIWRTCLDASGGPFLGGGFGILDCFYFPVLTRFRTYGILLDEPLEAFAARLEAHPAVVAWRSVASVAPALPAYDAMIRRLGGDPLAAL